MHITDDPTTIVLLGALGLLVGLPGILWVSWKVSRPPLGAGSFRWLYLAWASLLVGSSVWNLSRHTRLSVDEAGADNFVRLAFLSLGILVIVFVGARYRFAFVRELRAGVLGVFSLFALWGLASTVWSVSPASTLYKSSEYCAMLALFALSASLISTTFGNPRSRLLALKGVFDWNWLLVFLLIVSVYLGILIWPEYAILRGYRDEVGVLGFSIQGALPGLSANAVGTLGAVMGIVVLVRMLLNPGSRAVYAPVLVLSLLTMVLTQSRSPILAFLLAAVVVLVVNRRLGLLTMSGALLAVALLAQYGQLAYEFLRRGQSEQSLTTLTGRLQFWQASFEAIGEKPLAGWGANAGGRYVLQNVLGEDRSTVHSSWVEVLLDTGAVGLVLLLVGTIATWFWLFRVRPHAMGDPIGRLLWFESLGVLTVLCVRSVFSVTLVWSWYVIILGAVLVFVSVMRSQVARARPESAAIAQSLPATRRRRPSIRR